MHLGVAGLAGHMWHVVLHQQPETVLPYRMRDLLGEIVQRRIG